LKQRGNFKSNTVIFSYEKEKILNTDRFLNLGKNWKILDFEKTLCLSFIAAEIIVSCVTFSL